MFSGDAAGKFAEHLTSIALKVAERGYPAPLIIILCLVTSWFCIKMLILMIQGMRDVTREFKETRSLHQSNLENRKSWRKKKKKDRNDNCSGASDGGSGSSVGSEKGSVNEMAKVSTPVNITGDKQTVRTSFEVMVDNEAVVTFTQILMAAANSGYHTPLVVLLYLVLIAFVLKMFVYAAKEVVWIFLKVEAFILRQRNRKTKSCDEIPYDPELGDPDRK
ncbi:hypothetical protein Q1695_005820 [Nippostrongylus brasiliensis]|nr:hypothetical protein Q1695_005820 [Nippostrongylus brasiliensis]